ncbi:MAG: hypothetical protein Q8R48_06155, partial [Candidatus Omnitrophota bacterium]|nr:hypothetical protein [Candidatus Omnitrophota bacterium]
YEFIAGYVESKRMPRDWKFEGSNDGIGWKILDERKGEIGWKAYDSRDYAVPEPNPYKFYRFYFAGGNDPLVRLYEIKLKD